MINLVHKNVQEPALDEEDHLDWALDWNSSGGDNPRFGSAAPSGDFDLGQTGIEIGMPMAKLSRPSDFQIGMGKETERLARKQEKYTKCEHMVDVEQRKDGTWRSRMYDGERGSTRAKRYMEVKWGTGEITWRVKRQALLDAKLMRSSKGKIKVMWVFRPSKNAAPKGETELEQFLKTLDIKCKRM